MISVTDGILGGPAAGLDFNEGSLENSQAQVFDEREQAVAATPQLVDFLVGDNLIAGQQVSGISSPSLSDTRTLAAGTYNSHIVHFDPVGAGSTGPFTIVFDAPIRAVITSAAGPALLQATDAIFGAAGATYETGIGRRLEDGDLFTLIDPVTLRVDSLSTNSSNNDQLRIVTAVPLPAGAALLVAARGMGALLRRRA
ncbi:MAG: hypothetical protein AAFZ09_11180 [Pseudomonadota bacterium]